MCDSTSSSEILIGEASITSAPPLILLQCEEESVDPEKSSSVDSSKQIVQGEEDSSQITVEQNSTSSPTTVSKPLSSSPVWSGADGPNSVPATSDLSDAWNIEQTLSEDKNPFSGLTEEHLSRLEDVLSSEEVRNFLQQTSLSDLDAGLSADSVALTPSSSSTSNTIGTRLPDTGQLSDDSIKLDLFDNQTSDSDLPIDQALAHHFIQDSVREHELAVMAAAFNDHAYALPSVSTDVTIFSTRKSARIKQRMDDGKNAFESDSDFEYYLTPNRRNVKKDQIDQSDAEKSSTSPAPSSPAAVSSATKSRQPKRRSTRIVDMENREKAEKILQENRLKEQEAKAALQKQKEEESKDQEAMQELKSDLSPEATKLGKKQPKKFTVGKNKTGKQEEESMEDKGESADSSKTEKKNLSPSQQGQAEKKVGAEATRNEDKNENTTEMSEKKTKQSPKHIVKQKSFKAHSVPVQDVGKEALIKVRKQLKAGFKKKIKAAQKPVNTSKIQQTEDSSEDDLPLKAFAKTHKTEGTVTEANKPHMVQKVKKRKSGLLSAKVVHQRNKQVKQKKVAKSTEQRHQSTSGSEDTHSNRHSEKKKEMHKNSNQGAEFKADNDTGSKLAEKIGDKGKSPGAVAKGEDAVSIVRPTKHKHRKSEEVIIDPTVTDLFKPDGVIPTEHVKKECEMTESASKESKEVALVPVGVKHLTGSKNMGGESVTTEFKNGISGTHQAQHHFGQDPKNYGDAGPDKKGGIVHQVSLLAKQSAATIMKQSGSVSEHKIITETKPQVKTLVSNNDKETVQQTASVKSKAEKGLVKVIHSLHSQPKHHHEKQGQRDQSGSAHIKHDSVKSIPLQLKEEQKTCQVVKEETVKRVSLQPKEERKSLFEVLSKPETVKEEQNDSKSKEQDKKERKDSTEKKHTKTPKDTKTLKRDGHDSGDLSYEDDENDSDWEPANDMDTLYCICRKPHGNRFMICCDGCGEWYHGQCVGLSKQQGRQLEEENKEYICPVCLGSQVVDGKLIKQETDKPKQAEKKDKKLSEVSKKSRDSLDEQKGLKKLGNGKEKSDKEKWKAQRCTVGECKRRARLGSVFCSNSCIIRHAQDSLRLLRCDRERISGHKIADMRPSEKDHVVVMERRTGRVLTGPNAPTEAQLELWLQTHPSFEVMQPSVSSTFYGKKERDGRNNPGAGSLRREEKHEGLNTVKKKGEEKHEGLNTVKKKGEEKQDFIPGVKKEEKKEEEASSSKSTKTDEGPDQVRLSVRKSLRDALALRAEEADDIVLSKNEIKRLALKIEDELFSVYTNTGHKYRAKFRSLLFNIKDPKNKGLFRKILTRKIRASHLVKMSTEELASKELAKWRKMENKHTLAMIEQTEKEAMKEGHHHIRKKTHKGEVEVADEDMSTLVTHVEEQKTKVENRTEETVPNVIVDTTDQHRAHLFDLNCKICTGKLLPPASQEPAATKGTVTFKVLKEEKDEENMESKGKELTLQERNQLQEEKKTEEAEASPVTEEAETSPVTEEAEASPVTEEAELGLNIEEAEVKPIILQPVESSVLRPVQPAILQPLQPVSSEAACTPPSTTAASQVTVRSPDSALQSGLDAKYKFTPSGLRVWKGFISMQDFAKFFTSAYRVSGPVDNLSLPDTVQICGRIGPEQMWDYLGKIRQAGSRDVCILRFIPGSDDEKAAYVHLYSYLNSRGRCGVVGNAPKHIKDLYIVPLAAHGKIPQVLLPFDGPGLESNRPHMLIGIVVRQKVKRLGDLKGIPASKKSDGVGKTPGAKKMRMSKDEETEAYSPTADGDEIAGTEALYIPTPTAGPGRIASASSSSSSTPSSLSLQSSRTSANQSLKAQDTEPYSPSREVEVDEEDMPYDPEDAGQYTADDTAVQSAGKESSRKSDKTWLGKTTGCQAVAVSSSSPAVVSTGSQPATLKSQTSVNIDSVMEKISNSTDPQEISSIMVAILAKAKDSTEQQHLLAALTSRVEQQKRLKAEKQLQGESVPLLSGESSASILSADCPASLTTVTSGTTFSVLSVTPAAASLTPIVGSSTILHESKPSEAVSRISSLTPDTENMPLALKALMEELKGNTQMARAVDKRTERERKELEKKGNVVKEAEVEKIEETLAEKGKQVPVPWPKNLESVIPGLGEGKDEGNLPGDGIDTKKVIEARDKCDEVTSSTDLGQKEKSSSSENGQVTSSVSDSVQSDIDLRHQARACAEETNRDSVEPSSVSALAAHDRDDRFSTHPPLPMPMPPPSVGVSYPPTGPFLIPSHPALPTHPSHDVSDIDHRLHAQPPPMYPRLNLIPPLYPPRPSAQPPPPGTEVVEESDVDMRQAAKRAGPSTSDQPPEKLPRSDTSGSSHVVPPLPPLPPQPPPPPPPPPASARAVNKCQSDDSERFSRSSSNRSHLPEHWRRSQENAHDYDHRQHHRDQQPHFFHRHHHISRGHSPSPPQRYRHGSQDRDDRHRRDNNFRRGRR